MKHILIERYYIKIYDYSFHSPAHISLKICNDKNDYYECYIVESKYNHLGQWGNKYRYNSVNGVWKSSFASIKDISELNNIRKAVIFVNLHNIFLMINSFTANFFDDIFYYIKDYYLRIEYVDLSVFQNIKIKNG